MAQRGRKEFRGNDFQRIESLSRSISMVIGMDADRGFFNAIKKKDYEQYKELFAVDPAVAGALKIIQDRVTVCKQMTRGNQNV